MYRACVLDLFNVIWKDRIPFWDVNGLKLFHRYLDFMKKKKQLFELKNRDSFLLCAAKHSVHTILLYNIILSYNKKNI